MYTRNRLTLQHLLTERRRGIERGDMRAYRKANAALGKLEQRLERAGAARRRHKAKKANELNAWECAKYQR